MPALRYPSKLAVLSNGPSRLEQWNPRFGAELVKSDLQYDRCAASDEVSTGRRSRQQCQLATLFSLGPRVPFGYGCFCGRAPTSKSSRRVTNALSDDDLIQIVPVLCALLQHLPTGKSDPQTQQHFRDSLYEASLIDDEPCADSDI